MQARSVALAWGLELVVACGGTTRTDPGDTNHQSAGGLTGSSSGGLGSQGGVESSAGGSASGGTASGGSANGGQVNGAGGSGFGGAAALEMICQNACDKMDGLSFPQALCEDARARELGAYFCNGSVGDTRSDCRLNCATSVGAAPSDGCRAAWDPAIECIARSKGYTTLVTTNQPLFGACEGPIRSLGRACWGDSRL